MEAIFYVLAKTVALYLGLCMYLMLARAILSWFVVPEESRLYMLCAFLTEPVILPFRLLFGWLGIGVGMPIDLAYLASVLALTLINSLLPVI